MKAITLYEPYASLMAIGAKVNETRPLKTNHRGDICIHAALKEVDIESEIYDRARAAVNARDQYLSCFYGCIVAVVELWDVQPAAMFYTKSDIPRLHQIQISEEEWSFGNYGFSRWVYRTRNLRRLKTPVPSRGFQCVGWTVSADVEAKVLAQL